MSSIVSPLIAPIFPKRNQTYLAWQDLKQGLIKYQIWFLLAYQDIQLRYRRSVLGPFWITLSMAITAYSMGFLYGHLFHANMQVYFPFLVSGMLAWALISTTITDLIDTFSTYERMIKQIKLPYSLYINRVIARNYIIFLHNLAVMIPVLLLFHDVAKINLNTLLLIPGLLLLYLNGMTYGLILSMIGVRFRDVSQIVKSLIQVVFFVTPILWQPTALPPSKQIFVFANPFYAFVQLIRAPMLGMQPNMTEIIVVAIVSIFGALLCFKMFTRYRSRIVYWV